MSFIQALLSQDHTVYFGRIHFTNKDVSGYAYEHNEQLQAVFMNKIADIMSNPDILMFGHEALKDEHMSVRRRGWSECSSRCIQWKCFVWGHCFSILLILTLDGIVAYDIIEGSVASERFLQFLHELVVCKLSTTQHYAQLLTLVL